MNARTMVVALILGLLATNGIAGDTDGLPASPTEVNQTRDSVAIATIRARLTDSCRQSAECARTATAKSDRATIVDAPGAATTAPSTPERRRAVGLSEPSFTP